MQSDALVDTGAAYLTLPSAWRERLGPLTHLDTVSVETPALPAPVTKDMSYTPRRACMGEDVWQDARVPSPGRRLPQHPVGRRVPL